MFLSFFFFRALKLEVSHNDTQSDKIENFFHFLSLGAIMFIIVCCICLFIYVSYEQKFKKKTVLRSAGISAFVVVLCVIITAACFFRIFAYQVDQKYRPKQYTNPMKTLASLINDFNIERTGTILLPDLTLSFSTTGIKSLQYNYQDKAYRFTMTDFAQTKTVLLAEITRSQPPTTDLACSQLSSGHQMISTSTIKTISKGGVLNAVILGEFVFILGEKIQVIVKITNLNSFLKNFQQILDTLNKTTNGSVLSSIQKFF